MTQDCNI